MTGVQPGVFCVRPLFFGNFLTVQTPTFLFGQLVDVKLLWLAPLKATCLYQSPDMFHLANVWSTYLPSRGTTQHSETGILQICWAVSCVVSLGTAIEKESYRPLFHKFEAGYTIAVRPCSQPRSRPEALFPNPTKFIICNSHVQSAGLPLGSCIWWALQSSFSYGEDCGLSGSCGFVSGHTLCKQQKSHVPMDWMLQHINW